MAGLREQKKKQTRTAILEAALLLFSKKGYENTSIDELARRAGVGKGTIYSYFQAKSEIFLAFCEEQLQYVYRELADHSDPNAPIVNQLMTIFMGEFEFISRNKEFGRILMRETIFPKDISNDRSREIDDKYISLLVPVLKNAQQCGELRTDIELILVIGHLYAIYIMSISAWYTGRLHSEDDVAETMKMLFEQALLGLAPTNRQEKADASK